MPRLAISNEEKQNRFTRAAIDHGKALQGITDENISKVMGKTVKTVQCKYKNPSQMTMDDIRLYIRLLKLTDSEIVELVGGGNH